MNLSYLATFKTKQLYFLQYILYVLGNINYIHA